MGITTPPGVPDNNPFYQNFNLAPAATVDEGNNWVNMFYGPLTTVNPTIARAATVGSTSSASPMIYGNPLGNYGPNSATALMVGQVPAASTSTATAHFTGSIHGFTTTSAGTTLFVTAVASGPIQIGMTVTGTGVLAATTITAQLTGATGGIGTYRVNASQHVSSEALTGTITTTGGVAHTLTDFYGQTKPTTTATDSGAIEHGDALIGTGGGTGTGNGPLPAVVVSPGALVFPATPAKP